MSGPVLYCKATLCRQYYDENSSPANPIPRKDAADVLGYDPKDISDAKDGALGWVTVSRGVFYTTDEHEEGWDAQAAAKVLKDHLSGRLRVMKSMKRVEAEKVLAESNGKQPARRGRPPRTPRPGAEDWSQLHLWRATLDALDELGALVPGAPRDVSLDIKPKLAEHKVEGDRIDDRVASGLMAMRRRFGWVDIIGADPGKWYLTPVWIQMTLPEREAAFANLDSEGNPTPVDKPAVLKAIQSTPIATPSPYGFKLTSASFARHTFEGREGLPATVEVTIPLGVTSEERTALQLFLRVVAEELLRLA
jgi:hypothetical protein